ncbi:hypothetical protein [Bosea vaviloviae]|uniref:Uncharacterized protein n=1 Tax=Bosea vaviloviae TaxID=1526658 RepID=A0A1D7U3S0_9HYPH|nr:hypothetical protein [Bosea vaviloviae]AOO81982.1 hypothetical protein BHK69_17375 [Bosea vaviloviae]
MSPSTAAARHGHHERLREAGEIWVMERGAVLTRGKPAELTSTFAHSRLQAFLASTSHGGSAA